ncbi:MAG: nuclear transport factor 2 family protein [Burkholderiales bacterium]|nr:nuclear transport factor 2 family protein [Burkholderiales bacterium]
MDPAATAATAKQAVINTWKAFGTRDAAQIAAALPDDVEWHVPPGNATALASGHMETVLTKPLMVKFLSEEYGKLFVSDVNVTFTGLHAEGNTVFLQQRLQAKLANGRDYDNDYCFVIEVKEGRIHRMREYMDTQRGYKCFFGDGAAYSFL